METVCYVCNRVRSNTKSGISFQKLMNHVRREFKLRDIGLKLRTVTDKTLNDEVFYANGFYDPEDDSNHEKPIELIITHNFPADIVWYPAQSTELLIQVFDTVVHELRHQRQYRKRKFKIGFPRGPGHNQYLSDPDEIDAYSISIATELCRSLGRIRALRYLHDIDKLSRFKLHGTYVSPSLGMYRAEFPGPNDPVIRSLTKKIYVRLKKVDTDNIFM